MNDKTTTKPQETQAARPLLSGELWAWKCKRTHKNLGDVFITVECLAMQLQNPDQTSIFVEHNGEIKEVSRSMMVAPNAALRGDSSLIAGVPLESTVMQREGK